MGTLNAGLTARVWGEKKRGLRDGDISGGNAVEAARFGLEILWQGRSWGCIFSLLTVRREKGLREGIRIRFTLPLCGQLESARSEETGRSRKDYRWEGRKKAVEGMVWNRDAVSKAGRIRVEIEDEVMEKEPS